MLKRFFTFFVLLIAITSLSAQKRDKNLERELRSLIQDFGGDIGIYVKNLKNGKTVAINADTVFPTASIVKVPILIGVMDKISKGELTDTQHLEYRDSLLYAGVDILGSYKQGEKIQLDKVIMLMLTMSDNTASLWLQSLAGTGTRINALMDSLGLAHTRVNSRTPGREAIRSIYGWGQTTPREMANLMERIAKGEIISKERSNEMLRLLSRNYWDDVAISQIPAGVFIASKNGAVDGSRNEVLYVKGDGREYILSVFTKNNKDQSWMPTNEAWVLTRAISRLLWDRFD